MQVQVLYSPLIIKDTLITDNSVIEKAIPLFPEFMSEDAEEQIKTRYYNLQELKSKLSKLRMEAMALESKVAEEEKLYRQQAAMFNIVFAKKEIEEIKNTVLLNVVNHDDAGNWH